MTSPSGAPRMGPESPYPPERPRTNRAALLVIRAWRDDPAEPSMRARITEVANLDAPEEIVRSASTREELHTALDQWLDRLVGP